MSSRKALGGRQLLGLLVLPLVAGLLAIGPAPTASSTDAHRAPIDEPMTGLLPACPANMTDLASHDVWVEDDGLSQFSTNSELGLENNCAWQNMQDREDSNLWPRALNAVAEPNTVPINDDPTTVVFRATGLEAPGPFNINNPSCMPLSSRAGGCNSSAEDPSIYVAYRLANGSGAFAGPWRQVIEAGDNPYFDFKRDTNGCPDQYPDWTPNYSHVGLPCEYELNFATNVSGAPVLTTAMQVIVAIDWLTGTKTVGMNTGQEYGYEAVVPMLFTPGSSVSLSLGSLPTQVAYDTKLNLKAHTEGPPEGSAISFYRRTTGGGWSYLGQDLTDDGGDASLLVPAKSTAQYRARVTVGGNETFESNVRSVSVLRKLGLKAKKLNNGKVKFTAAVTPGTTPGNVTLQRKKGSQWKTVETSPVKGSVVWKVKPPDGKSSWRILTSATPGFASSSSKSVSVNTG